MERLRAIGAINMPLMPSPIVTPPGTIDLSLLTPEILTNTPYCYATID